MLENDAGMTVGTRADAVRTHPSRGVRGECFAGAAAARSSLRVPRAHGGTKLRWGRLPGRTRADSRRCRVGRHRPDAAAAAECGRSRPVARPHNRGNDAAVGFYGLDVYSLWESMDRVIGYLEEHDPAAVEAARAASRCFEPYAEDPQRYAFATRMLPASCEEVVVSLLSDLRRRAGRGPTPTESEFDALQNAEVLAGAERYYRRMMRADAESWNVRDCHMVDTLDRLIAHHGPASKAIVWEHNTHVGDARATDMASVGMLNVGQVVRQRHHADGVVLVGFGGYDGSVIASSGWGAPMQPASRRPSRGTPERCDPRNNRTRTKEDLPWPQPFVM